MKNMLDRIRNEMEQQKAAMENAFEAVRDAAILNRNSLEEKVQEYRDADDRFSELLEMTLIEEKWAIDLDDPLAIVDYLKTRVKDLQSLLAHPWQVSSECVAGAKVRMEFCDRLIDELTEQFFRTEE